MSLVVFHSRRIFVLTLCLNLNIYWVLFLCSHYPEIDESNAEDVVKSLLTSVTAILILCFIYFKAEAYQRRQDEILKHAQIMNSLQEGIIVYDQNDGEQTENQIYF